MSILEFPTALTAVEVVPLFGGGVDAAQTGMSIGQRLQTLRAAEVVGRTGRRLGGGPGEDWRTFHGQ
jgi:hypothetical protein